MTNKTFQAWAWALDVVCWGLVYATIMPAMIYMLAADREHGHVELLLYGLYTLFMAFACPWAALLCCNWLYADEL